MDAIYYYDDIDVGDSFGKKTKRVVTSTLILTSAFIVVNFLLQLLIGLMSKILGYQTTIGFTKVISLPRSTHEWSLARVVIVYSLPPLILLFIGYLLLNRLLKNTNWIDRWRYFTFCCMICTLAIPLAHLSFIPFGLKQPYSSFYQTFSIVATWLRLPQLSTFAFTFVACLVAILSGWLIGKEVLRFSFSSKLISTLSGKRSIINQLVILPLVIAAIPILFLSRQAAMFTSLFPIFLIGFIGLGMIIRTTVDQGIVRCNKDDIMNVLPLKEGAGLVILYALVLVFFR